MGKFTQISKNVLFTTKHSLPQNLQHPRIEGSPPTNNVQKSVRERLP
jgi:hypothetical protein